MKKTHLFILAFVLMANVLSAQFYGPFNATNENFRPRYLSFIGKDEQILKTWYHYVVSYHPIEKRYILRLFYPEKKLLLSETRFLDKKLTIRDGSYKSLIYTDGHINEGQFTNNVEEGEWTVKNDSGVVFSQYAFVHGKREGEGIYWYDKDKLERKEYYLAGKKTGKWLYFYENGNIKEEENYVNDKLQGENKLFDSTGGLKQVLLFEDGELVKKAGDSTYYEAIEIMPYFKGDCAGITDSKAFELCNTKAMYKYILQTLKYPKEAQKYNVSGKAFVKFIIEKDGSVGEVTVLNGLCQSLEDESIRVIKNMPNWEPGYQDGRAVRVYYTIPLNFVLE